MNTRNRGIIFILAILLVVSGYYFSVRKNGEEAVLAGGQKALSDISIPYYYYDSAYDLGVKGCDNPGCDELSPGLKQGEYDKSHEGEISITGEVSDPQSGPYSRRQMAVVCTFTESSPHCTSQTFSLDLSVMNYSPTYGHVELNSMFPSRPETLTVDSAAADKIVARSHFKQEAGGEEYRIDRINKKLSIVYYEDKDGVVTYSADAPVRTLIEKSDIK